MKTVLLGLLAQLPRLLLVAAVLGVLWHVHGLGVDAGSARVQAKWDQQTIAGITATSAQLTEAIARTAAMGDKLDAIYTTNQQGHADAKRASQNLLSDLRSGALRLSIPAAASGADVPGTGAGGAAVEPGQARTELDPATGASLVAITDDGNAGIRDLNTCIDAYNAVRSQVNGAGANP